MPRDPAMANSPPSGLADTSAWIRRHEIGRGVRVLTPFGPRLLCYADLTATGRHLRVVSAPRGRATQMNLGAAQACAPDLLFVHADTRLADESLLERAPAGEGAGGQAGTPAPPQ